MEKENIFLWRRRKTEKGREEHIWRREVFFVEEKKKEILIDLVS